MKLSSWFSRHIYSSFPNALPKKKKESIDKLSYSLTACDQNTISVTRGTSFSNRSFLFSKYKLINSNVK